MRYIELAKDFAEHLGEVLARRNVGQELAVVVGQTLPVYAVHVCSVEA